jgi:hypothetical protein
MKIIPYPFTPSSLRGAVLATKQSPLSSSGKTFPLRLKPGIASSAIGLLEMTPVNGYESFYFLSGVRIIPIR